MAHEAEHIALNHFVEALAQHRFYGGHYEMPGVVLATFTFLQDHWQEFQPVMIYTCGCEHRYES